MSKKRRPLLIVEDAPALPSQMRWAFDQYEVVLPEDKESAIAQFRPFEPAGITMNLGLPPHHDDASEAVLLLEQAASIAPDSRVIVIAGQPDRVNALRSIALGGYDFGAHPTGSPWPDYRKSVQDA